MPKPKFKSEILFTYCLFLLMNRLTLHAYNKEKQDKVRSILLSYFIHMGLNINESIFCTKNEKLILKKRNSM